MELCGFILDDPGVLSERAIDFLGAHAEKKAYDVGLTGDALRRRLIDVFGPGQYDDVVSLVEHVQQRWGGLAYRSGLFDSPVIFSPMCDPEDADGPIEIDYAVASMSPAGASISLDGGVLIGFDDVSVREFSSLDSVIECDAMFASVATSMPATEIFYDSSKSGDVDFVSRVRSSLGDSFDAISEASGENLEWFANEDSAVYACSTWSRMLLGLPAYVRIWATSDELVSSVQSKLADVL
ncbi:hypothetical protein LZG04_00485 [Saccharothrix sp. S26]|uniref:hypothetical protein n=1 Tax=Saccharothrix sp. S26 TaxID=2907215 RepID=UPI001F2978AD|nr:hypothetical protein [Saccharothrix sp. S26]MCE6993290.1 hypothetical protein [Saccharothrix sp. S26]